MTNSKRFLPVETNAALISIHPQYVEKILSGEKRLEFRRGWTRTPVDFLVIYATNPIQQIVAIAELGEVIQGTKTKLWELARDKGGGISRRKLFAYMEGKKQGVALELIRTLRIVEGINPSTLLGDDFHPPQSFRYLSKEEFGLLKQRLGDAVWV